jgi:hypothetical protein
LFDLGQDWSAYKDDQRNPDSSTPTYPYGSSVLHVIGNGIKLFRGRKKMQGSFIQYFQTTDALGFVA